jgi:protein TonB
MEPKKNPRYDVHRQRGVLLNVGLVVSIILIITAFNWKISVKPFIGCTLPEPLPEISIIDESRFTEFKNREAPAPKPVQKVVTMASEFIETSQPAVETNTTIGLDPEIEPIDLNFGAIDIPVETLKPDTFRIVEKMPEPVGGWAAFYKTLSENIKYPRQAERSGTKGKVFVEFTVNEKGQLSHFKILKGIGYGCDEEAKRVLALTQWNAGKQRGRPVNVKLVQPINFNIRTVN